MSLTFIGSTASLSDLTTYSFVGVSIGTAGANRTLIIGVHGGDSASAVTINGVTVDGNAAAEQIDTAVYTGRLNAAAIYTLDWATGTTATIDVTFSEAIVDASISVWAAYDLVSATAVSTIADEATAAGALDLGINTVANGYVVAIAGTNGTRTHAWTGLTPRDDTTSGGFTYTAADFTEDATASTPLAITCDPSGTSGLGIVGCAAVFALKKTIQADPGSYAITGSTAALKLGRKIAADSGSFAISGTAATLKLARKIAADAGSYSLTGTAASLEYGFEVIAGSGAYTITGQDAGLFYSADLEKIISAEAGAFSITGSTASLKLGRLISASSGTFAITGSDAQLEYGRLLSAQSGAFAITGSDATLYVATVKPPVADLPVFGTWTLEVDPLTTVPLKVVSQIAAMPSRASFPTVPLAVIASQSLPLRVRQRFSTA